MSEPTTNLTPAERDEYDYWLQRIPSGGTEEALWNLMRLQIRHDTAGIRMEVAGWPELMDAYDASRREVVDAARNLSQATEAMTGRVDEAIAGLQTQINERVAESEADRGQLRAQAEADRVRLNRVARTVAGLAVVLAALVVEALVRYWPLIASALLSAVLVVWRGL